MDDIHEYLLKGVEAMLVHGGKDQEDTLGERRQRAKSESEVTILPPTAASIATTSDTKKNKGEGEEETIHSRPMEEHLKLFLKHQVNTSDMKWHV